MLQRKVVIEGKQEGRPTIDYPITSLDAIEDEADVKETPEVSDHIPIMDSSDLGQMKKIPVGNFWAPVQKIAENSANFFQELICMLVSNGSLTAAQCNSIRGTNGLLKIYPFANEEGFTMTKGKFDPVENVVYI